MAQRRMFSLKIIDTDMFLDMPQSTRLLYYELCMRADDDGFVASPKKILKMVGCSEDDYKILMAKQYIIPFESGICVIKHWLVHNLIRSDRYIETEYELEKSMLVESNNKYELTDINVIPNGNQMEPQVRLGKDSIGEDNNSGTSPQKNTFKPPTLEEVQAYCKERNNKVDAERWMNHYTSNGWKVGKNSMKDWKAAVRTWEKSEIAQAKPQQKNGFDNFKKREYDGEALGEAWLGSNKL
jgi:hypothetical protein